MCVYIYIRGGGGDRQQSSIQDHTFHLVIRSPCGGLVTPLFPTLCDFMDCSPVSSPSHGISQGRILEWVAISFSRESSQPRSPALQVGPPPLMPPGSPQSTLI